MSLKEKVEFPVSDCSCENSLGFSDYYMSLRNRWYKSNWSENLSNDDIRIMIDSGSLKYMEEEKTRENIIKYVNESMNFCSHSLWKFLTKYCEVKGFSSTCSKCNGSGAISKYFTNEDVKEAVEEDDMALIELIGRISGLRLVNKFNINEVNHLLAEYKNKKYEIFGDFKDDN